jgi:hypothetical protein
MKRRNAFPAGAALVAALVLSSGFVHAADR